MTTILPMRSLGKTDIRVTPIGLGVMELSGGGGLLGFAFPVISPAEKNAIIRTALEGGINWFDTAELYGNGVSEQSLATALKAAGKLDGEVVIATKWWPLFRSARNISKSIHARLRHLQGFSIDNYMVHQPFSFSSPEAEMDAMADLVEAGLIRSVGVSNFTPQRMLRAARRLERRGLPLAVNQVYYSLLHRDIERDGTLQTAQDLGVTIVAYTPLESGLLSGKYHRNPDLLRRAPVWKRAALQRRIQATRPLINALEEIASRYAATPAQVALNWLIHFHGERVVTIPGATRAHQAQESAHALTFKLDAEELARLDELTRRW